MPTAKWIAQAAGANLVPCSLELGGKSPFIVLEDADLDAAAATGAMYKVTVSGSFNGYVQALLWNSVTGIFSDLSGFRNGVLTNDP